MFIKIMRKSVVLLLAVSMLSAASLTVEDDKAADSARKKVKPPEGVEFTEFDTAPKPADGFASIVKSLKYPESARKGQVEGRVIVWAEIAKNGNVTKTKIETSLSKDCDAAAMNAIKAVKWEPATKDEKALTAWVAIPIEFRLQ